MAINKKITLWIIGCGAIGKFHVRNIIQNFRRVKIKYICGFEQFFKAITEDKVPICKGIDGLKNILICNAAKKSADSNKPVKIDYSICR